MRSGVVFAALLVVGLVLAACGEGRRVGTLFEPYCAPDGSVVMYQKPNADGSYDGAKASPENCR